jgi:hypothetical protein
MSSSVEVQPAHKDAGKTLVASSLQLDALAIAALEFHSRSLESDHFLNDVCAFPDYWPKRTKLLTCHETIWLRATIMALVIRFPLGTASKGDSPKVTVASIRTSLRLNGIYLLGFVWPQTLTKWPPDCLSG